MAALIICNGTIEDYSCYDRYIESAECIICADGGARHAGKLGLKPDILLGDFDSITSDDLDYYRNNGAEILKFPAEKDMTDTELAIEVALQKGYKKITLIGALGTRIDHSLSNIFLLKKILDNGAEGIIANERNEITLIKDTLEIRKEKDLKVTLLPLAGAVSGVSIKGFYYPLTGATLEVGSSWGVSNEIVDASAKIKIENGLLLVIKSRD